MKIYCDSVVLPTGRQVVESPALVTIKDATITSVQTSDLDMADADIHLRDAILAPALVNSHTHLALHSLRGLTSGQEANMVEDIFFKVESKLSNDDIYTFAAIGAYEALLSGTGLVWDHYYAGESVARAIADTKLCGVVAPTLQDVSGPGVTSLEKQLQATESLNAETWQSNGIWSAVGPHATDTVSDELWKTCTYISDSLNVPIHAHLSQSREEWHRSLSAYQKTPTRRMADLGCFSRKNLWAHAIYLSAEDYRLLESQTIAYCLLSQSQFAEPANIVAYENQGIDWTIATDCAASNDSMNLQREISSVSTVAAHHLSNDPEDTSRESARKNNASIWSPEYLVSRASHLPGALHPQFLAGAITPGAIANLVVYDKNHPALWPGENAVRALAYSNAAPAIRRMMTMGQWLTEDFNHSSICKSDHYAQTVHEASKRYQSLRKSI